MIVLELVSTSDDILVVLIYLPGLSLTVRVVTTHSIQRSSQKPLASSLSRNNATGNTRKHVEIKLTVEEQYTFIRTSIDVSSLALASLK